MINYFIREDGLILVLLDNLRDLLLVAFGSILGANTRFLIYKKLEKIDFSKDFLILLINVFASFCLGLFVSIYSRISFLKFSDQFFLFFLIGFLGSLSTFSTFIYDLFDLSLQLKIYRALRIYFMSLILGIFALAFGFLIGM